MQFEFLALAKYNSEKYVVLLPVDDEEERMVVILKIESFNDEDEDTIYAVFQIFKNKYKNDFDFEE